MITEIIKWTGIIVSTGLAFVHLVLANIAWNSNEKHESYYNFFQTIVWLLLLNIAI